jgi:hypothetical protein
MTPRDEGAGERKRAVAAAGRRRRRGDTGYERWLTDRLHELYDPILREPIPDDLERLLGTLEPRPKPDPGKR